MTILRSRLRGGWWGLWAFAVGLAMPAAASAVTEPNGKIVPAPVPAAEVSLVAARGFESDAITLSGLFAHRGEQIDYVNDASTAPGAFVPLCGFTGQMVLRGGGCQLDFGWYNATSPPTVPTAIYPLIPKSAYSDPSGYACPTPDFCPLATHDTTISFDGTWHDRIYDVGALRNDPNYTGGLVGFAIIGNQSTLCTETHYSQNELNPLYAPGQPWVESLIWKSTSMPNAYYIGFEDLPVAASSTTVTPPDGDFNDFVFFLSFIGCDGEDAGVTGGNPGTTSGGTSTSGSSGGGNGTTGASGTTGTSSNGNSNTSGATSSASGGASTGGEGTGTGASAGSAATGGISNTGGSASSSGDNGGSPGSTGEPSDANGATGGPADASQPSSGASNGSGIFGQPGLSDGGLGGGKSNGGCLCSMPGEPRHAPEGAAAGAFAAAVVLSSRIVRKRRASVKRSRGR